MQILNYKGEKKTIIYYYEGEKKYLTLENNKPLIIKDEKLINKLKKINCLRKSNWWQKYRSGETHKPIIMLY